MATLDNPPDHDLFSGVNPDALGAKSSLLQRRLELQNQKNAPPAPPAAPQINFNFPPEFANLLRPPAPIPPPGAIPGVNYKRLL